MIHDEIDQAGIVEMVKIVSLQEISKDKLQGMVDEQGNVFMCSSGNPDNGLDDTFPDWLN